MDRVASPSRVPSQRLDRGGARSRAASAGATPGLGQRGTCACGGGCPRCTTSRQREEGSAAPKIVQDVLRTPGAPLPGDVRNDMQSRFGADFSTVRIHSDAQASVSAKAVDAAAYTVGSHIVFSSERFALRSPTGRRTLAHELTHVLQQRGAAPTDALSIVPGHDASEREASHVSARVDGGASHSPVRVQARSSVQRLQRQRFDEAFERATGVTYGIDAGTMRPVSGVDGATFDAVACGGPDCNVHFQFQKAYIGRYPTLPISGARMHRGVYVKIVMRADAGCGSCDQLDAIQVVRDVRKDEHGALVAAEPPGAVRQARSGWGDPTAPSRGWRVDATETSTDPYYTHTSSSFSSATAAAIWDAPWSWDHERNVGKQFQTCLICTRSDGSRTTLACVQWGYYIDASGIISFRPPLPVVTCGESTELRDAVHRWEAIPGNQSTGLSPSSVPETSPTE